MSASSLFKQVSHVSLCVKLSFFDNLRKGSPPSLFLQKRSLSLSHPSLQPELSAQTLPPALCDLALASKSQPGPADTGPGFLNNLGSPEKRSTRDSNISLY